MHTPDDDPPDVQTPYFRIGAQLVEIGHLQRQNPRSLPDRELPCAEKSDLCCSLIRCSPNEMRSFILQTKLYEKMIKGIAEPVFLQADKSFANQMGKLFKLISGSAQA